MTLRRPIAPTVLAVGMERSAPSTAKFAPRGALALNPAAFGLEVFIPTETRPETVDVRDGVAVVEIVGPLMHHEDWCFDSYDAIHRRVAAALASEAHTVLLSIDSPGGLVAGCFDAVSEIRAMAEASGKPLHCYVDAQSTSAAYALACASEKIWIPPAGLVGSIGVIDAIVDATAADKQMGVKLTLVRSGARKTDGNPHESTSEAAIAATQAMVDSLADLFFGVVASRRPITAEEARSLDAGILCGQAAIDVGLADELATFDQVLARLQGRDAAMGGGSSISPVVATSGAKAVAAVPGADGKFEENKHPRKDDGKFGSGGGGGDKKDDGGDEKKTATSEKHGEAKVRTRDDLAKELPKDAKGKQHYGGFPLDTIHKVHEFSGETGLKAIIFRKDRGGKEVKTYQYTDAHEQAHADAKFVKAAKMAQNIGDLRKRTEEDSASKDRKTADSAVVVRLIDATTIRVGGSDSEKETGSVGATTLRAEHVIKNDDGSVTLKFKGKSHKDWERKIEGPLAQELLKRVEGKEPGDRVFGVSASDVNGYLEKASPDKITAKDFRTFHASSMAFDILSKSAPPPKITAKEAEAKIKEAVELTSKHLGNTPSVCREKYINPRVLDFYRNRVVEQAAA